MRTNITLALATSVMLLMSGCGGGGGGQAADPDPQTDSTLDKKFSVQICTSKNKTDAACSGLDGIDLGKNNVALLSAPDDIGASPYIYFDGNRIMVVPKEESEITALHMMAQGLVTLAEAYQAGLYGNDDPIPGIDIIMKRLATYKGALSFLEEHGITGTQEQNDAILKALNLNLEMLGSQGLTLKQAYDADIKAMAETLVNLATKEGLSGITASGDDKTCIVWEYGECTKWAELGLSGSPAIELHQLLLSRHEAADIAMDIRAKSGEANALDKVFEKLSCEENEEKHIYMYGLYDNFDPSNPEPTNPNPALAAALPAAAPYLHDYDHAAQLLSAPSFVIETLSGIPATLTKAYMAIGLKEGEQKESNIYLLGSNIGQNSSVDVTGGSLSDFYASWSSYGSDDIYYKDMSQLAALSGETMLQKLQNAQALDFLTYATVNVDFIAVAACLPKKGEPDPTPVPEIPTKLQCNADKGEQALTIWGGTADDFAAPTDSTNPSTGLSAILGNYVIAYDEAIEKSARFGGHTSKSKSADHSAGAAHQHQTQSDCNRLCQ